MEKLARYVGVAASLLIVMSVASPALAGGALFQGKFQRQFFGGTNTIPAYTPTQTATASLQGGTGPAGFVIPSGVWSTAFSFFSYSFPPTYVNVTAYVSRKVYAGNFTKSYFTPSVTITQNHNESLYPNAYPTSPAPGFMRMKIGPNGFGGPMPLRRETTYIQTVAAYVGYSQGTFHGTFTYADGAGGKSPFRDCCAFSYNVNTVTLGKNGAIWVWDPTNAFATGTVTVSGPLGGAEYFTAKGVDSRVAGGWTGTIQLVAPRLAYSYALPGQVPPQDGSATPGGPNWDSGGILKASLTFLPEPSYAMLLGSGLLGLFGLQRWRRRRS